MQSCRTKLPIGNKMRQEGTVCVCSIGRQWQRTQNWSPEEFFSLEFSDSGSHSVQGFIDQLTYFYGYTGIIGHSLEKKRTGDQQLSMLTSSCCLQTHLLNQKDKNRELSSDLVLMRGRTVEWTLQPQVCTRPPLALWLQTSCLLFPPASPGFSCTN